MRLTILVFVLGVTVISIFLSGCKRGKTSHPEYSWQTLMDSLSATPQNVAYDVEDENIWDDNEHTGEFLGKFPVAKDSLYLIFLYNKAILLKLYESSGNYNMLFSYDDPPNSFPYLCLVLGYKVRDSIMLFQFGRIHNMWRFPPIDVEFYTINEEVVDIVMYTYNSKFGYDWYNFSLFNFNKRQLLLQESSVTNAMNELGYSPSGHPVTEKYEVESLDYAYDSKKRQLNIKEYIPFKVKGQPQYRYRTVHRTYDML